MPGLRADNDSAHVRIPPPLMLVSTLLVGRFIHWLSPVSVVPEAMSWSLGSILILVAVSIAVYSAWLFRKAQTRIEPWKTTSNIITTGIYSRTRNPIYLAFLIGGFGVALAVNSLWMALLLIPLFFILQKFVIEKEERYLEQKFSDKYRSYKLKVRRWI